MFEWLNRHKKNIMTWTLYLVVPSFVLMYGYGECAKPQIYRWAVKINGEELPEYAWQNAIQNLERRMQQYKMADLSREELRQQALETSIYETLYMQKVKEWGIGVTNSELAAHIQQMPEFQDENQKFRFDKYQSLLASVGYHPLQFEEQQRESIAISKLRMAVQRAYFQPKSEKDQLQERQDQKAVIEYLEFKPSSYTSEVEVDEPGMQAYYEKHKEDFKKPEQRRIAYVKFVPAEFRQKVEESLSDADTRDRLVHRHFEKEPKKFEVPEQVRVEYITYTPDMFMDDAYVSNEEAKASFEDNQSKYKKSAKIKVRYIAEPLAALAETVNVTDEAIADYYEKNKSRYTHGEQAKASHILMRVTPGISTGEDEAIKQKLLDLRKKIEDGKYTFEEAAKQFSNDKVSAEKGGDLGYFGRGRMVPAFEKAAFELPLGQMSEPIKTQFGYHIILVNDRKEEGTDPLDDVRDEIKETLQKQHAVTEFRSQAKNLSSLDDYTGNASIQTTDWFSRGDNLPAIPQSDSFYFTSSSFAQIPGQSIIFSGNTLTKNVYLIEPLERQPVEPMTYEEAKDQVMDELKRKKAQELASIAATADMNRIKNASETLEVIANERSVEIQQSELFGRQDQMVPGFGARPTALINSAMALQQGQTDGPLKTSTGEHIIRLLAREPAHIPEFDEVKEKVQNDFMMARMQVQAKAAANSFADQLFRDKKTLSAGAPSIGKKAAETELFPSGGMIPNLGYKTAVNKAAFELEKDGDISNAVEQPVGYAQQGQDAPVEAYYVIELLKIKKPYIPELAEVKDDVEQAYKLELAGVVAEQRAEETLQKIKKTLALNQPVSATQIIDLKQFEDQGEDDNSEATYNRTEITGSGSIPGLGRAISLTKTAMALAPKKVSNLVKNNQIKSDADGKQVQGELSGVYIVNVLEKPEPEAPAEQQSFSLAQYMEQQAQMRAFSAWIGEVSAQSTIEYNPDVFKTEEDQEDAAGELASSS